MTGPEGVVVGGPPRRTSAKTVALSAIGIVLSVTWILVLSVLPAPPPDDGSDSPIFLVLVGLGVLARSVSEPLVWWSKTYVVGERSMVIDSGVLARHRREVPFDRIQQVDLRQPFVARIFDLAVLQIDTAGEGGSEPAHLRFLERRDAELLRQHLLRRRDELARARAAGAVGVPTPGLATPGLATHGLAELPLSMLPPPPADHLLAVSNGHLALAGLTEEVVLIGLGSVVACLVWLLGAIATGSDALGWIAALGSTLTFGTVVVAMASGIGTAIRFGGFTLVAIGDDLALGYGVIERRQLSVPRRRIQRITVLDNPVRRALGFASVQFRTAASPGAVGRGQPTTFVLPVVRRDELDRIIDAVDGGRGWWTTDRVPRPPAAARRAVVHRCALALLVVAVPAVLTAPAGLALALVPLAGIPLGRVAHARAGHAVTATSVVLARGVVRHRVELVPLDRVQSCRTTSSPFQRRRRLATLHVDVAGSAPLDAFAPHLYDMDATTALELTASLPRR